MRLIEKSHYYRYTKINLLVINLLVSPKIIVVICPA